MFRRQGRKKRSNGNEANRHSWETKPKGMTVWQLLKQNRGSKDRLCEGSTEKVIQLVKTADLFKERLKQLLLLQQYMRGQAKENQRKDKEHELSGAVPMV